MLFGRLGTSPAGRAEISRAINLGLNCAVGMALFSFIGFWLDQRRGGEGRLLCTLLGMTAGLAYGAYEVWKVIRDLNHEAEVACREREARLAGKQSAAGADRQSEPAQE